MDNDAKVIGKQIKQAMEENAQDSPVLNIDPDSGKPSIVGNPNNIPQNKGNYSIDFLYPSDMVKEEEKANLVLDKKTGYYKATVHYTGKRIKPLYRGMLVVKLTNLFASAGVLKEHGYKKDISDYALGEAFQEHILDVADIARSVLGIPEDQVEYISPNSLVTFLNDLLKNEPNILEESYNFLA